MPCLGQEVPGIRSGKQKRTALEGEDKSNLITVITSDIELLEFLYAHTISPIVIATLFSLVMCLFIGRYHWSLGILTCVWIFHILYFVFGVKTIKPDLSPDTND